jgi:hypothetical protein
MAYGTDKHDDYFLKPDGEHSNKPMDLAIVDDEMMLLKEKMARLAEKRELIIQQQKKPEVVVEGKEQDHA